MKVFVNNFKGHAPKIPTRNLPTNFAEYAENVDVSTGDIRLAQHRLPNISAGSTSYNSFFKWTFNNKDYWHFSPSDHVSGIEVPILDNSGSRSHLYYLEDGGTLYVVEGNDLPTTPTTSSISNQKVVAGLSKPTRPRLGIGGTPTGDSVTSVSYVVCFGRAWANGILDIGPASDPAFVVGSANDTTIDVRPGQTVTVAGFSGANAGGREACNTVLLFRSVTTSWGSSTYQLVANQLIDTTSAPPTREFTIIDNMGSPQGITLPEHSNTALPTGASGFISLNNGLYCAYKGSTLYVSNLNRPYAFPQEYTVTIQDKIVGVGAYGNTAVLLTDSAPVLVTISDPTNPVVRPMQDPMPCMSKRSIVSTSKGVMYASDRGIILLSSSAPQNVTQNIYDAVAWKALNPNNMICNFMGNSLYMFHADMTYYELMNFDEYSFNSLYATLTDSGTVRHMPNLSGGCRATFWDKETSSLFVASMSSPGTLQRYSVAPTGTYDSSGTWTSKVFVSAQGDWCPAAIKISSTSALTTKVMLKGITIFNGSVPANKPYRLPAGYTGDELQFSLTIPSGAAVHSVTIASSMTELLEGEVK